MSPEHGIVAIWTILTLWITALAGWVTHVVWTIKLLMSATEPTLGQIALAAIGVFAAPIGSIHGFILWFS